MCPWSTASQEQQTTTCPYPQPDESSPLPIILSLTSILTILSHIVPGLQSGIFPSCSPTRTLYAFTPFTQCIAIDTSTIAVNSHQCGMHIILILHYIFSVHTSYRMEFAVVTQAMLLQNMLL